MFFAPRVGDFGRILASTDGLLTRAFQRFQGLTDCLLGEGKGLHPWLELMARADALGPGQEASWAMLSTKNGLVIRRENLVSAQLGDSGIVHYFGEELL